MMAVKDTFQRLIDGLRSLPLGLSGHQVQGASSRHPLAREHWRRRSAATSDVLGTRHHTRGPGHLQRCHVLHGARRATSSER